jgi:hypothetical protein
MTQGTIRKLIHLCNGTDFPATHLVPAHNGVGYGYIQSLAGDVFFDDLGLKNLRFDQLQVNMAVEYVLEDAPYLRTSSVTALLDRKPTGQGEAKIVPSNALTGSGDPPAKVAGELMDAVDASSIESFPASDSPAHCVSMAPKLS